MESLDPGALEFGEDDSETPGEAVWRPQPGHNVPDRELYHAYCTDFDEIVEAAELCEADELNRLRAHLDQQLSHLQSVIGKLANRLQRRLLAKQIRSWNSTSRKATSTPAASRGWSRTPPTRSPTRWRRRRASATPW